MNKFKKILLISFLSLVSVFYLSGCDLPKSNTKSTPSTSKNITVPSKETTSTSKTSSSIKEELTKDNFVKIMMDYSNRDLCNNNYSYYQISYLDSISEENIRYKVYIDKKDNWIHMYNVTYETYYETKYNIYRELNIDKNELTQYYYDEDSDSVKNVETYPLNNQDTSEIKKNYEQIYELLVYNEKDNTYTVTNYDAGGYVWNFEFKIINNKLTYMKYDDYRKGDTTIGIEIIEIEYDKTSFIVPQCIIDYNK